MTFYELESKCKKKRRNFYIFVLLIIILTGIIVFVYLYYNNFKNLKERVVEKKVAVKIKDLNQTKKTNEKKDKKQKKILINFVLPKVNFEVNTSITKITTKKTVKKDKKDDKIKKNIAKNKTDKIISIHNLPSFQECIKKAKYYYEKKDYKNAFIWAKNANLQDNKNPISWIISAKSLYKLGKKNKAIQILELYYKYNKVPEIKLLINKMKKGSF